MEYVCEFRFRFASVDTEGKIRLINDIYLFVLVCVALSEGVIHTDDKTVPAFNASGISSTIQAVSLPCTSNEILADHYNCSICYCVSPWRALSTLATERRRFDAHHFACRVERNKHEIHFSSFLPVH